ncbi:hypothetical protein ACFQY8_03315 [Alloscardovia venturai]|uniref:Uncharacterized protein n=1 Tax=Alloscardovia venturai TaxID=1769421 RepID=A0ABW2Y9M2_9BIFI
MLGGINAAQAQEENDGLVSIDIGSKGSIQSVKTASHRLDPAKLGAQIPVRVVTTYSYKGHSASDSRVIAGKSGRVRIDISVYNVTGRSERVHADVNGKSVSRTRWISTPMAVAASAELSRLKLSSVVTPKSASDSSSIQQATNGVVGADTSGKTTIQWAGLTGVDTDVVHFFFVADAKNFVVPSINVFVQPGFSINMNSKQQQEETKLVLSTLKTLDAAGKVFTESGEALSKARTALETAGGQIGQKTIADLNESNARVEASASQVSSALQSVEDESSAMFSSTGSLVSGQLAATTRAVQSLMGNPTAHNEEVNIDSQSCSVVSQENSVADNQSQPASILGVIRALSGRLTAMGRTTTDCQKKISEQLDAILGPQNPDTTNCALASDSLSCQVWTSRQELTHEAENSYTRSSGIVDQLENSNSAQVRQTVTDLGAKISVLDTALSQLNNARSNNAHMVLNATRDVEESINNLEETLNTSIDDVKYASQTQTNKTNQMKRAICVGSGLTTTTDTAFKNQYSLDKSTAQALLNMLADSTCPTTDLGEGANFKGSDETSDRDSIEAQTSKINSATGEIENIASAGVLQSMRTNLNIIETSLVSDSTSNVSTAQVHHAQDDLHSAFTSIKIDAETLTQNTDSAAQRMSEIVDENYDNMQRSLDKGQQSSNTFISRARDGVNDSNSQIFSTFTNLINSEATGIEKSGSDFVSLTNRSIEDSNKKLSDETNQILTENARVIDENADNAIVDTQAASALLSEDISRVLSDIGSRGINGGGLLGAIATSEAHLGMAETKFASSNLQMGQAKSIQRDAQSDSILDEVSLRASLARLESPMKFTLNSSKTTGGWFSFHLVSRKGN